MITREAFHTELLSLLNTLEKRRNRYLKLFWLGSITAFIFILAAVFFPHQILRTTSINGVVTRWHLLSLYGFVGVYSLFFILAPAFFYRGSNGSAAIRTFGSHKFSLKDEAYSALFKLFGKFEFAPRGGVSLVETRHSLLFSEAQFYLPEDLVMGKMNNVAVKLCEINVAKRENQQRVSLFKGLLVALDICETSVKLRSPFEGRALLKAEGQEEAKEISAKQIGMKPFPLPAKFESGLKGYTTRPEEAKAFISPDLLESIAPFAAKVQALARHGTHWDDKLAFAFAALYSFAKEKIISLLPMGHSKLASEIAYDKENKVRMDLTRAGRMSDAAASLNQHFALEYFENKVIITIPCRFDLYETDSLFSPPVNRQDADVIYSLMEMLDNVTRYIDKVKH